MRSTHLWIVDKWRMKELKFNRCCIAFNLKKYVIVFGNAVRHAEAWSWLASWPLSNHDQDQDESSSSMNSAALQHSNLGPTLDQEGHSDNAQAS